MKREFTLTLDGVAYKVVADGNTILVNGQPFVVGNGVSASTLNLVGGGALGGQFGRRLATCHRGGVRHAVSDERLCDTAVM